MAGDDEIVVLIGRLPLFLPVFALVLFRVGGLLLTAPVFGAEVVPIRVRAALVLGMGLLVCPIVLPRVPMPLTLSAVLPGLLGELLIGLTIGLAMNLAFLGVQVAGAIMGQQAGLALGGVFNPVLNTESTVLEEVLVLTATTIFVLIGGHRALIGALLDTYQTVPLLSLRFNVDLLNLIVDLLGAAYGFALRLTGPVLITLLLSSLVMGILSRTMPHLNILTVGFLIQVLLTLTVAGLVLAASQGILMQMLGEFMERAGAVFDLPSPRW